MKKLLLAIGEEEVSKVIRKYADEHFDVLQEEVYHGEYLNDYISEQKPDVVIVHDFFLGYPFSEDEEEERQQWLLQSFQKYREDFNDEVRIAFICDRPSNDPFLAKLVGVNVLDIFHKRKLDIKQFMEQLIERPHFRNVKPFLVSQPHPVEVLEDDEGEELEGEENEHTEEEAGTKEESEGAHEIEQRPKPKSKKKKPKQKQKIVYRDRVVEVEKEVVKKELMTVPNTQVAIINLWPGAGATTLSINLSRAIAKRQLKVGLVENPLSMPYLFDYLEVMRREQSELKHGYVDVARQIEKDKVSKLQGSPLEYKGIQWYVNDSRLPGLKQFDLDNYFRLLITINSTFQIVDMSHEVYNESAKELLKHMDHVFVVLEPDPVKLDWLSQLQNDGMPYEEQRKEFKMFQFIENLNEFNVKFDFILNKNTENKWSKQFIQSLPKKPLTTIPTFSYEDLNECIWKSEFLYDQDEQLDEQFKPILSKLLPREYVDLPSNNKKKIWKKLNPLTKKKVVEEKAEEGKETEEQYERET